MVGRADQVALQGGTSAMQEVHGVVVVLHVFGYPRLGHA